MPIAFDCTDPAHPTVTVCDMDVSKYKQARAPAALRAARSHEAVADTHAHTRRRGWRTCITASDDGV